MIIFSFFCTNVFAQNEVVVDFLKSAKVVNTTDFRFSIESSSDTVSVFKFSALDGYIRKINTVSAASETLKGVIEFKVGHNSWEAIEYEFDVDPNDLKRIEI